MDRLNRRWVFAVLILAGLPLAACSGHDSANHKDHPAEVSKIEGSELSRVTLTEKAMKRIDLQTTSVREQGVGGSARRAVPYSSLIYDPSGRTWVYTNPQPRTFVRQQVDVDRIEGDWVLLNDGPAPGSEVASVGVTQLYGAETGVGH